MDCEDECIMGEEKLVGGNRFETDADKPACSRPKTRFLLRRVEDVQDLGKEKTVIKNVQDEYM